MLKNGRRLKISGLPLVRRFSSHNNLVISNEVQSAIASNKPIVALESTIITHGLPYPENLNMAKEVEELIRQNNAVPATTAFIRGKPVVGLTTSDLEYLSKEPDMIKVSRRDVPYVMSKKLSGGTTIAGTMILAHRAGIRVFATGGLGGVHRGVETTMDVSADLDELGRTPVAVVCSGPKSILDIDKTMEYLETKGVHVSTYGPPGTNVPGFYTSDSGVESPYNFRSALEAAELLAAADSICLNSGTVFCVPTPKELELPSDLVNSVIEQALEESTRAGVKGKAVTPFLLKKIWEATKGSSLTTNVGFVKNNAVLASQIATEYSKLKSGVAVSRPAVNEKVIITGRAKTQEKAHVAVIGTLAVDFTCTLRHDRMDLLLHTSTPGKVEECFGGVAHNVALASSYLGSSNGIRTMLISEVGSHGNELKRQIATEEGIDVSGILVNENIRTASYIAMHNSNGELLMACADMESSVDMNLDHVSTQIKLHCPKVVVFDGNIGSKQIKTAITTSREVGAYIIFEPTSVPKSALLTKVSLSVFPNHDIDIAIPNAFELKSMFDAFHEQNLFDVDKWFPVIDALGINQDFRQSIEKLFNSIPDLKELASSGISQQAMHLLPYIPNIFVKLGSKGAVSFQLVKDVDRVQKTVEDKASTVLGKGKNVGVLVQHFPAHKLDPTKVVSVTGAGDTFCGIFASELAYDHKWLTDAGQLKNKVIAKAQFGSALTLQSSKAVSPRVKKLNQLCT